MSECSRRRRFGANPQTGGEGAGADGGEGAGTTGAEGPGAALDAEDAEDDEEDEDELPGVAFAFGTNFGTGPADLFALTLGATKFLPEPSSPSGTSLSDPNGLSMTADCASELSRLLAPRCEADSSSN